MLFFLAKQIALYEDRELRSKVVINLGLKDYKTLLYPLFILTDSGYAYLNK